MIVSILYPYVLDVGILLELGLDDEAQGCIRWLLMKQSRHYQILNRTAKAANVTSNTGTVSNTPTSK
jgi:hypothetical protein